MQGFLVCGVCLPKMPLRVDPYFQILISHLLVRLASIICNYLYSSMVEHTFNHTAVLSTLVPLVTLCDRKHYAISSRERRTIPNRISTWPGEPKQHAWGLTSLPPTLQFPFLSSPWIRGTLPDYRVRPLCTRTSRQNKTYFYQEGEWSFLSPVQSGTKAYRLSYISACG